MPDGHDWTLKSIQYDWLEARAVVVFQSHEPPFNILVATGVVDLNIPQKNAWGPSVSVSGISTPSDEPGGLKKLTIEMQSGDVISVVAKDFGLELA